MGYQLKAEKWIYSIVDWRLWPTMVLYFPIIVYSFFFGLLNGGRIFLFALVNPDIPLGGFAGESKIDLIKNLSSRFKPRTILIDSTCHFFAMLEQFKKEKFTYPIVVKPNTSEGGFLVCKINNELELKKYHNEHSIEYLIQEYLFESEEFGILFHRRSEEIVITSFTQKQLLSVKGDGTSTIHQLLNRHPMLRKRLYHSSNSPWNDDRILKKDQEFVVDFRGNLWSGATIIDMGRMIGDELNSQIKELLMPYPLLFYGRVDIKSKSLENVLKGDFKVIEINGVKGEAQHIYSEDKTLFEAYGEIFKHWKIILKIAKKNMKNGYKYPKFSETIGHIKSHREVRLNAYFCRNE